MTGVLDGTSEEQMEAFIDALQEYSKKTDKRPENWMEAFRLLRVYLKRKVTLKRRCIVFLDELPSMDTQRSGFIRALGYFWNSWASMQDNLTLIVCGSATSWMIKNVVNDKGGLHDRITQEIHLHPFTLHETETYLKSRNFKWERLSILQAYMALGGVPYYLSLLHHNESFSTNIDRLFFGEEEELRREYKRLYSTLFQSPESYMSIVNALSKVKHGVTCKELSSALGSAPNGTLSQKLEDLVNCDIIRKYVVREKRISNRSAIYQLTDFYSQFYLTFVPRAEAETNYWTNHIGTPEINTWLGLCFERVCMTHVTQIKKALGIDRISTKFYSWQSKQSQPKAQIDMILDRADGIINLCEMKYSKAPFRIDANFEANLLNKRTRFIDATHTKKAVHLTMVCSQGLERNSYADEIQSLVTGGDLFAE